VAQALPSHTVMQASYVGSMSRNQLLNGSNGHIEDANGIAASALFTPDPKTGKYENTAPISPANGSDSYTGPSTNDWRPLINYGDIWLQTHGGYANYNSCRWPLRSSPATCSCSPTSPSARCSYPRRFHVQR